MIIVMIMDGDEDDNMNQDDLNDTLKSNPYKGCQICMEDIKMLQQVILLGRKRERPLKNCETMQVGKGGWEVKGMKQWYEGREKISTRG